jgi:PAS domain S-box-containing protein
MTEFSSIQTALQYLGGFWSPNPMTPLSIAYVATAAICIAVGLQHLLMALRVEDKKPQLLFAIAALGVAADAVFERRIHTSSDAAEFLAGMPWTALCIATAIVSLSWFIALRAGVVRRGLLWIITALAVLTVILDFSVGISYTGPVEFGRYFLPWGEAVSHVTGAANPLRVVGDLVLLGFLFTLLDITVRMARRGERRQTRLLGGSLAIYALGLLTIIPSDLGWFQVPTPHTFAFLVIVAAMSWDLSEDLLRAALLSREVVANERRWRQLLDSIQLLVVGIGRDGRITMMNSFAEKVSGYPAHEMLGKHYLEFVAEDGRDKVESSVNRGLLGDPQSENERGLVTRDGEERVVRWRSVVLRDLDGEVEGLLSVGADVTERRRSEAELQRTTAELESAVTELEDLRRRLEEENVYLREEIRHEHGFEGIVGGSDPLLYVLHKVREVAPSDTSALILGETGVGKELIARTIHAESPRAHGPFVVVNCAALPPNLIESELFGHERGAFTGADRQRRGRFELAHGGTIFLDEVGELPLETQPKLLRVLQEGEIERVGGSQTISVDVRVIAATNRDLNGDMKAGRFREDLFYRVAVYPITVPPLRDRREDIPPLVQHFAQHYAQQRGKRIDEIPAQLMRRLQTYDWPGNVRELQNVIERAVLTSTGDVLKLAEPLQNAAIDTAADAANEFGEGLRTLDQVERRYIERVLASTRGKISGTGGAAEVLGLHANTLRYRMKKLGIPVGRGKNAEPVDR